MWLHDQPVTVWTEYLFEQVPALTLAPYHDTEVGPMIDNEVMQAFESLKEPQRLSSFTQLITFK